ncbi:uncharacterized protein [Pyxicephalus adspersus]|uniref:uncharacterized protein isoform X1 n=1 Tax=Pyxicephalus adspersus TaxID=30357 RepID=UPI003B590D7F
MNMKIALLLSLLFYTVAALEMTGPSTHTATAGSTTHIPCTFTADKLPVDVRYFAVFWYFEGKTILVYDNTVRSTNPRYSLDKNQALKGIADLTIFNTSVSDDGRYICSVTYSPFRKEKEIRLDITAIPKLLIVNKVVTKNTKSVLLSITSGFYPAKIDIKWLRDREILKYIDVEEAQRNPDGTYSVRSSVKITPTEEDRERIFSCRVQHGSLTAPLREDFQLVYGARPLLSILSKSVQRNTKSTLTCMASGFFPYDIDITWYKDGEILKNQHMGKPHKNNNGTYEVTSTVTITPNDNDENRTFSCRAQHISLQEPLQEDFQLVYQQTPFLSTLVITIIVIVVVVIIVVPIAVILCKQKLSRKASETTPNISPHASNISSVNRVKEIVNYYENLNKNNTAKQRPPNTKKGTQEGKDQYAQSLKEEILADNGELSDQEEECEPSNEILEESYEEQSHGPGNIDDNSDSDIVVNSSPSNLETEDDPMKLPIKMENEQNETQSSFGQPPAQKKEATTASLRGSSSSTSLQEEDPMKWPMKMENEQKEDHGLTGQSSEQEKEATTGSLRGRSSSTLFGDEDPTEMPIKMGNEQKEDQSSAGQPSVQEEEATITLLRGRSSSTSDESEEEETTSLTKQEGVTADSPQFHKLKRENHIS